MKEEIEICVKVNCSYDELHKDLTFKGFTIKEEYFIKDIYMINSDLDISSFNDLDILKSCALVRDIENIKKVLLYKYKEFNDDGDIIKQGKVECPIEDIDKAILFMNSIGYKELIRIFDKCIVYANDEIQLVVQLVNDKFIYIEVEDKSDYVDKVYDSIEEMKNDFNKYNFDVDNCNYFVKKALDVYNS